ncbi:MAG: serine hydrolase [Candidatus Paceibacterota bacterium]|jgi:D-alanyl-D-alanine endopeptidase (penicillin-binding protein 7)
MRNFFTTVFGGLAVVGIFMILVSVIGPIVQNISSWTGHAADFSDSGWARVIRFSALEEEDPLESAVLSISDGSLAKMTAEAYTIRDLTTSKTIVTKNVDQLRPMASLTKLVTAVVARKLILPNERVTITNEVLATYGNTAGLKNGETFQAEDLQYPLLMVSSNDAAEALARSYGRRNFIKAMNEFTQSIGAYRTYMVDPSGLSPKNVSTANDLTIILDWIRKNDPSVLQMTTLKSKTIRDHSWINPTHFLSWSDYIGGKNGYLPESDRTSASLFSLGDNKHVYAIVLLGSETRDADWVRLVRQVTK